MRRATSYWSLLERPALAFTILMTLVVAIPGQSITPLIFDAPQVRSPATDAAWRVVFIGSALLGAMIGSIVREGQLMLLAWSLPRLRTRHAAGLLRTGLVPGIVATLVLFQGEPFATALSGGVVAVSIFMLAAGLTDPGLVSGSKWIGWLLVLWVLVRSDIFHSFALADPWLLLSAGVAVSALVTVRELSATGARMRPLRARMGYTRLGRPRRSSWTRSIAAGGFRTWLAAADYERAVSWKRGLLALVVVQIIWLTFVLLQAHIFSRPRTAGNLGSMIFLLAYFTAQGRRPTLAIPSYPPRSELAGVHIAISAIWNAMYCTAALFLLFVISQVDAGLHPMLSVLQRDLPEAHWMVLGVLIGAPIAQWGGLRYPPNIGAMVVNSSTYAYDVERLFFHGCMYVLFVAVAAATGVGLLRLGSNSPSLAAAVACAAVALAQYIYFVVLRRHFARADLG